MCVVCTKLMCLTGDPASKSTKVEWKDKMDLTKRAQAQMANRKRRHFSRTFFHWFQDNTDPSADDIAEVKWYQSRVKMQIPYLT